VITRPITTSPPWVGDQLPVVPAQQMAGVGVQILPVDVLIGALLLDHEDLAAQAQDFVQLVDIQLAVVHAHPFDGHVYLVRCFDSGKPQCHQVTTAVGPLIRCAARVRNGPS
jgi:hypothetical protein